MGLQGVVHDLATEQQQQALSYQLLLQFTWSPWISPKSYLGDHTLPLHIVKAMVFLVVTCRCKSWTIKKTEHWRIDAFELWCWRRLLRVPGTAKTSTQSILKEINTEYSLEGLMLKLKLQYFGHLMRRVNSLEKTLMLQKIESRRRKTTEHEMVGWHHWLNGHESE